jgi:hypothetical protein
MRRSTILLLFVGFLSVYASAELHYNRAVLSKVESWPKTWARISISDPTEKMSFVIALKQNNLDLLQVSTKSEFYPEVSTASRVLRNI